MTAQRGDFERPPAPAEPGDTDRATARELLTAPHPRTDVNPYWRVDMLAYAIAAAREQGRAEVRERVEAAFHGGMPDNQADWRKFSHAVRAALEAKP